MTKFIIESITKDGMITKPLTNTRYKIPHWGDGVLYPDGSVGMIETVGTWGDDNSVHVCRPEYSAFMRELGVSISGGPWDVFQLSDLEPLYSLHKMNFWTWASTPMAYGGVSFSIDRPIFRIKQERNH